MTALISHYLVAPATLALFLVTACSEPVNEPATTHPELMVGTNSRSPNLAQSEDGLTVLSWIESAGDAHLLRFSQFVDGQWTQPSTVAEGENWFVNWADFPSVVPAANGLWGAHWLESQPEGGYAYDIKFSMSADGGRTWGEPIIPHTDGTPTEHGFVSLYQQDDGIGMIWLDGRNMINEYDPDDIRDGMTLRSAVFGADGSVSRQQEVDGLICDCCQTDVTVTTAGPLAAYRNRTEVEIRDIYIARPNQGVWETGVPVGDDNWEISACPVNGPALSSKKDRVAIAWFSGSGNIPQVLLATSEDAGHSFSDPVKIATGNNFGHVGVALLDGAVAVSWLRKSAEYEAELVVSVVRDSGSVGAEIVLGQDEPISGYSVPQIMRHDNSLIVAWTAGDYENSNVRTALVPLSLLQ